MSRKLTKRQRRAQQIRSANRLHYMGGVFYYGGKQYYLRCGTEPWRERIQYEIVEKEVANG